MKHRKILLMLLALTMIMVAGVTLAACDLLDNLGFGSDKDDADDGFYVTLIYEDENGETKQETQKVQNSEGIVFPAGVEKWFSDSEYKTSFKTETPRTELTDKTTVLYGADDVTRISFYVDGMPVESYNQNITHITKLDTSKFPQDVAEREDGSKWFMDSEFNIPFSTAAIEIGKDYTLYSESKYRSYVSFFVDGNPVKVPVDGVETEVQMINSFTYVEGAELSDSLVFPAANVYEWYYLDGENKVAFGKDSFEWGKEYKVYGEIKRSAFTLHAAGFEDMTFTVESFDGIKDKFPTAYGEAGHEVLGWYEDEDLKVKFDIENIDPALLGEDIELWAEVGVDTHKVQFYFNDEIIAEVSVVSGELINPKDIPEIEAGYTLLNWKYKYGDATVDFASKPITEDIMVEAVAERNTYNITVIVGGKEYNENFVYGSSITGIGNKIEDDFKEQNSSGIFLIGGYTDEEGNAFEFKTMPARNVTVTADIMIDASKIKLTISGDTDIAYNGELNLTADVSPVLEGVLKYTVKWYKDGELMADKTGANLVIPGMLDEAVYTAEVTAEYKGGYYNDVKGCTVPSFNSAAINILAPSKSDIKLLGGLKDYYLFIDAPIEPKELVLGYMVDGMTEPIYLKKGEDYDLDWGANRTVKDGVTVTVTLKGVYEQEGEDNTITYTRPIERGYNNIVVNVEGLVAEFGMYYNEKYFNQYIKPAYEKDYVKVSYDISKDGIYNVGKYNVTVTVADTDNSYGMSRTFEFTVNPIDINSDKFSVELMQSDPYIYTGNAILPEFRVWYSNPESESDRYVLDSTLYSATGSTAFGDAAYITIKGDGKNITGSRRAYFTTVAGELSRDDIDVKFYVDGTEYDDYVYLYTGEEIKPEIRVYVYGKRLYDFTGYYTSSLFNNTDVGTAKITLDFTGAKKQYYLGVFEYEFQIAEAELNVNVNDISISYKNGQTYGELDNIITGTATTPVRDKDGKVTGYNQVDGTFTFAEPDTEIGNVGTKRTKVTFVPANAGEGVKYPTVTTDAVVNVTKADHPDKDNLKVTFDDAYKFVFNNRYNAFPQYAFDKDFITVTNAAGDMVPITGYKFANGGYTDAGEYQVTISFENYNDITANLTVNKLVVNDTNTLLGDVDNYRIFEGIIDKKGGSFTFDADKAPYSALMMDAAAHNGIIRISDLIAELSEEEKKNIFVDETYKFGQTDSFKVKFETVNYSFDLTFYIKVKTVKNGDNYYTVEDALANANSGDTLIVTADTSFADSKIGTIFYANDTYYTVKEGVTLLLPFNSNYDDSYKEYYNDRTIYKAIGERYVTLDMPQNITLTVNGTMTVNAKRGSIHTYISVVPIEHSAVYMAEDSRIIVSNDGNLNVVGFIYGEGSIYAEAGSTVVEAVAILGFRGGTYTTSIWRTVVPFNQYFINSIEVKTVYQAGAKLTGHAFIIGSRPLFCGDGSLDLISADDGALIKLIDGYVTKEYDTYTGKIRITTDGTAQMNNISIQIGSFQSLKIESEGQEIPFPGNFDIVINSGSITADYIGIKLLPGASLTVNKGATLNLLNGSRVFVYNNAKKDSGWDTDMIEWTYDGLNGAGENMAYPVTGYGDAYRETPQNYYNMSDDAVFIVNGTVNVEGSGYNSIIKENISSTIAGYVTSTESGGVINLKVEQKALTIKEYKDAGPTWWNNTNILSFEKGKYDKNATTPVGKYVSTVSEDGKVVTWAAEEESETPDTNTPDIKPEEPEETPLPEEK